MGGHRGLSVRDAQQTGTATQEVHQDCRPVSCSAQIYKLNKTHDEFGSDLIHSIFEKRIICVCCVFIPSAVESLKI